MRGSLFTLENRWKTGGIQGSYERETRTLHITVSTKQFHGKEGMNGRGERKRRAEERLTYH